MAKQVIFVAIAALVVIAALSSGCAGFFSGYGKKAQEYTSADYSITQYKFFIDKYNAIRQMGSQVLNKDRDIENFEAMYGDPKDWDRTTRDNYEDHIFVKNGYVQQYNLFVSEYNARMRDLTTNQMWMKPQNFPESIPLYAPGSYINLENSKELDLPER